MLEHLSGDGIAPVLGDPLAAFLWFWPWFLFRFTLCYHAFHWALGQAQFSLIISLLSAFVTTIRVVLSTGENNKPTSKGRFHY
jgi:hypothetical protein